MPNPIDPKKLGKLAHVAIKVGLNLQPGQELVISAPVGALELVRLVTAEAYKAGAHLVTALLSDDQWVLARHAHAPDASFDVAAGWLHEGMAKAYGDGAARLAIYSEDPMLLSKADPDKVARANKANAIASKPAREKIANFETNWTIISYPDVVWARQMFPGDSAEVAAGKLADAIFAVSRADLDDPVAAWAEHDRNLHARAGWLNHQRFAALHFSGPGTDLRVGLADGHEWAGGSGTSKTGITCMPNIPTEEVFTTPHASRVDGVVSATKPLSYNGTLIEDIVVRFEGGRIVEASAGSGEEVLKKVLDTDEGARHIGEVALVPHSSPISQAGVLFFNTLFDENAASHIALGQCYSECFTESGLSTKEIVARGGNQSLVHIDWMIGSGDIDVDGVGDDGGRVPVMRKGEWV